MIYFKQKGDFSKTDSYFKKLIKQDTTSILEKYAKLGVEALKEATPVETGKTASSWYYTIERNETGCKIIWSNSNFNKGVPIAIILQYGHATGTGGWVEGTDYINPAMRPIFEELAEKLWKETTES